MNCYIHILKLYYPNLINKKHAQPGPAGSHAGPGTGCAGLTQKMVVLEMDTDSLSPGHTRSVPLGKKGAGL